MTGRRLLVSAVVVSLVQIAFLGWMIAGRAAILRDGEEVLLKVEPIDPRDLLRGDYVALGYEISTLPVALFTNLPEGTQVDGGEAVFARLKRDTDGYWRAISASMEPFTVPAADGEVDIKGALTYGQTIYKDATVGADFGIGRFYLPEGDGLAIEKDMRVRPFGIKAAIAADGTAQIKALMDGDKALYEEPFY
jgi:uncharacterized membrane-anchored protein